MEMRAGVQQIDIDAFVRENLPLYKTRYEPLLLLTQEHDCTFVSYEDMINDFESWARQLGSGLGLELTERDIASLRRLGGFDRPVEKNISKHIRQRSPGDHRRKLSTETIAYLHEQLGQVLRGFGYA